MNAILKNRKVWLAACGLWLAVCGLWLGQQDVSAESKEVKLISSATLTSYSAGVATAIQRILIKNKLTNDDLYKLDFSQPNDLAFGDNPQFEIFNSSGGGMATFDPKHFIEASEKPVFIYTLGNRVSGVKTEATELLAIFPHPFRALCEQINRESQSSINGVNIPKIDKDPSIEKFPKEIDATEIIELPWGVKGVYGCIEAPSGLYFYQVLVER